MEYEIQTFYFLKYPELFVCVILSNQRMNQVQRSEHLFIFPSPRSGLSGHARCSMWSHVAGTLCSLVVVSYSILRTLFILYIVNTPTGRCWLLFQFRISLYRVRQCLQCSHVVTENGQTIPIKIDKESCP